MAKRGWLKLFFSVFCLGCCKTRGDNKQMNAPEVNYVKSATLVKVVDGDTIRVVIDLGWNVRLQEDIRLSRVNAPESRGRESEAGKFVTQQVVGWLGERLLKDPKLIVHSKNFTSGKFGRAIADIWANGECLNDYLLDSKLAWKVDEHGKQEQPREIELLDLPDSIRESIGNA